MLIDELMPSHDATRIDHRVIEGPPTLVYEAALEADFARSFDDSRVARGLTSLRSAVERAVAFARNRQPSDPGPVAELRLAAMESHGQYVVLGTDPPREIAFGMIGRFWAGETTWLEIDASEFSGFHRPGYARIACNLSFRDYGEGRTLVSYETRTQATDPEARSAFLRYWRVAGPLAGFVLRAQLRLISDVAAAGNSGSRGAPYPDAA